MLGIWYLVIWCLDRATFATCLSLLNFVCFEQEHWPRGRIIYEARTTVQLHRPDNLSHRPTQLLT